jgi:hypothetical protein
VEIMGSQKCGIVGKSQPGLLMINPMISTRTRRCARTCAVCAALTRLGRRPGAALCVGRQVARELAASEVRGQIDYQD